MKLLLITLLTTIGAASFAQETTLKTVLSQKTVNLRVDISTAKMKLSSAGYWSPVVKVLVPDLADVTILDHRNAGEEAPCLATYDAFAPQDVIQNNPSIENVDFEITLQKSVIANNQKGICEVTLTENINGLIRGFAFTHSRSTKAPDRLLADCR